MVCFSVQHKEHTLNFHGNCASSDSTPLAGSGYKYLWKVQGHSLVPNDTNDGIMLVGDTQPTKTDGTCIFPDPSGIEETLTLVEDKNGRNRVWVHKNIAVASTFPAHAGQVRS